MKDFGCECEKWKANQSKLKAVFDIAWIHGFAYEGDSWDYCPWCSRLLTPDATDGLPVPPKITISKQGQRLADKHVKYRRR